MGEFWALSRPERWLILGLAVVAITVWWLDPDPSTWTMLNG